MPDPFSPPIAWTKHARLALLLAACAALTGCNMLGWVSNVVGGEQTQKTHVTAEYRGLEGKRVAVIVAADEYRLFEYPNCQLGVSRAVSRQLAADIKGIELTDPAKIAAFQSDNAAWITMPNRELLRALDVDRLVYIELKDYTTHEPGNRHVWRGVISGRVSVAEADAAEPNNFAYANEVYAAFPPDEPVGVLGTDDATIQAGMLGQFATRVSGLFHDYNAVVKK
jgi:hypothetical protein